MDTPESGNYSCNVAVTYQRNGATDLYRETVENVLDLIENALASDGWESAPYRWSMQARGFVRSRPDSGTEVVSFAITP